MCICSGLVGLKSENVEKVLVLQHFLKGQGSPEHSTKTNQYEKDRTQGSVCDTEAFPTSLHAFVTNLVFSTDF